MSHMSNWDGPETAPTLNTLPGVFQPFFSQFPVFHPLIDYINNFQWETGVTPFSSYFWGWGFPFVYLTILFTIKKFMENRKPMELKGIIGLHNAVLMVLSIFMFVGTINAVIRRYLEVGLYDIFCMPNHHHIKGDGAFWEWVFYVSKFYELLDSVLLALGKKRNLNFLHVYHHFIVVPLFWSYNTTYSFGHWMLILTNTWVHIFMYYYFAVSSAFGWSVWWKKYITIMQLVQFFFDLSLTWPLYPMEYIYGTGCSTELWTLHFGQFIGFTFVILFYRLYKETYNTRASTTPPPRKAGAKKEQ